MRKIRDAVVALSVATLSYAADVNVMPMPARVTLGSGRMPITQAFRVTVCGADDGRVKAAVDRLMVRLSRQTGMPLGPAAAADKSGPGLDIRCESAGDPVQNLREDESYRLEVNERGAALTARNPLGALRGIETFLQLVSLNASGFSVPYTTIDDTPRFAWRGLHLDVARHFIPVDVVKRNLDAMAAVKLNVFHWHLSDDQGFRVESKRFPKLQNLGSDGLYYTQDQIRDVIAYARDRGIRVLPEFDIPGHSTSWLVGYPEIATMPGPYRIERTWGIFDPTLDPTKEATYEFLDGFIGEMAALFPDEFFHIGGDEVNGKQWAASKAVQQFMVAHGLKDKHGLQAYFNQRVQAIVSKYGKRMVGWDEILSPDLPKDIVIHSWRGQKSLAEAARMGYSGILSSGDYLDQMDPAEKHYAVDPLSAESAGLSAAEKQRILGGEACTWAEFVTPEIVDSRIWPRTAAIAERFWSPANVQDVASMYRRLDVIDTYLDGLGLKHHANYRLLLERIAGGSAVGPVEVLADVIIPVNLSGRERSKRPYNQQTPLNRIADTAQPESASARHFLEAVRRKDYAEARRWLELWRDNDARFQPIAQKSALLAEMAPVSRQLSTLARAGLEALAAAGHGRRLPAKSMSDTKALLSRSRAPIAEVRIAVLPGIAALVDAASTGAAPRHTVK